MTHEGEEACNRECFVAIADHFKVNGVSVKVIAQERDEGVYGHQEQNSYDTKQASAFASSIF